MSVVFATQLTAVATLALAALALATAVLALLSWRKPSKGVADQAAMLELQRRQLAEQEKTSAKQAGVLELQTVELRESLEERKREAEDRRRSQAAMITAWFASVPVPHGPAVSQWGAMLRNAAACSRLPVPLPRMWNEMASIWALGIRARSQGCSGGFRFGFIDL
jgi:hypothetical protein